MQERGDGREDALNVSIHELLNKAHEAEASDLIVKVGKPPLVRVHGELEHVGDERLMPEDTKRCVGEILTDEQRGVFDENLELDFAYSVPNLCRFRCNIFKQRGSLGLVFRRIPNEISGLDEIGLPEAARKLAMRPRGLVLVTGPAGSGKSTTQASLIDYRNSREACHIITVEDPVEFMHKDKKAVVNQRQVGSDTVSFARALKSALRQDPDVILVGEMRDLETISLTLTASETGHLAFGTLHTTGAAQTVDRVIDAFPSHQQQQVRMQLSVNLLGVISQVLVRRADGQGRTAAFEILLATPAIQNLIREGKTVQIKQTLQLGSGQGMVSLNRSLAQLVSQKLVTLEEAAGKSPNPQELEQLVGARA